MFAKLIAPDFVPQPIAELYDGPMVEEDWSPHHAEIFADNLIVGNKLRHFPPRYRKSVMVLKALKATILTDRPQVVDEASAMDLLLGMVDCVSEFEKLFLVVGPHIVKVLPTTQIPLLIEALHASTEMVEIVRLSPQVFSKIQKKLAATLCTDDSSFAQVHRRWLKSGGSSDSLAFFVRRLALHHNGSRTIGFVALVTECRQVFRTGRAENLADNYRRYHRFPAQGVRVDRWSAQADLYCRGESRMLGEELVAHCLLDHNLEHMGIEDRTPYSTALTDRARVAGRREWKSIVRETIQAVGGNKVHRMRFFDEP